LLFKRISKLNFIANGDPTFDSIRFISLMNEVQLKHYQVKRIVEGRVYLDFDLSTLSKENREKPPKKDCSETCIRSYKIKVVSGAPSLMLLKLENNTEYG